MTDKIMVLTTCESEEDAARMARELVEKRVAACVNIVPGVRSVYRWEGSIQDSAEVLLVIKSRSDLFEVLRAEILKSHPYDVPEVIAIPVVDGSAGYFAWLDGELG